MKHPSLFFALGVFGILHQKLTGGMWWQWEDILTLPTTVYPYWHHEPIILAIFVASIALLIINYKRA